jgi:hypothetical protein
MGQLPPEVGDQMIADLEEMRNSEVADKAALLEYSAGLRPPPQNNMSEIELYMQDPAKYAEYMKAKGASDPNGGRMGAESRMMQQYFAENPDASVEDYLKMKNNKGAQVPAMDATDKKIYTEVSDKLGAAQTKYANSQFILDEIEKNPNEYFGNRAKMSNIMANYAKTHEGALGQFLNAMARGTATPEMLAIDSKVMRSVLEDMKMLGGNDSNQELETILRSYIDSRNNPQAAMKFMEETARLAEEGVIAHEKELEELTTVDSKSNRPVRYTPGKATVNYKQYAKEERARRVAARKAEREAKKNGASAPAPQGTSPQPSSGGWKVVR